MSRFSAHGPVTCLAVLCVLLPSCGGSLDEGETARIAARHKPLIDALVKKMEAEIPALNERKKEKIAEGKKPEEYDLTDGVVNWKNILDLVKNKNAYIQVEAWIAQKGAGYSPAQIHDPLVGEEYKWKGCEDVEMDGQSFRVAWGKKKSSWSPKITAALIRVERKVDETWQVGVMIIAPYGEKD
jgi:hypothetical protein